MRCFFALSFLLIVFAGQAQPWKSYTLNPYGDTLNRLDQKGLKQGPWVIHVDALRGEKGYDEQGFFVNDKKDGRWVRFSPMGDKVAEENYRFGAKDGKCTYYTDIGFRLRDESWRAIDPSKSLDTVPVFDLNDPNKIVDHVVVKLEGQTVKHGTWTYYDPETGDVIKTERYFLDKLQTGLGNGDDELAPIGISGGKAVSDTAGKKAMAKPQVILDYEKKNSGKKKVKVRDGSTGY